MCHFQVFPPFLWLISYFLSLCMPDNFYWMPSTLNYTLLHTQKFVSLNSCTLCSRRQLHRNWYFAAFSPRLILLSYWSNTFCISSPVPLSYGVFYSGKQEHELFTALCELWWWRPGDTPQICLLFSCAAHSSLVLCPMSFAHFDLSGLPGLFSQLRETSELWCSLPELRSGVSRSRHHWGTGRTRFICCPSLRDPCSARLKTAVLIYIIRFFSFFKLVGNSSSCSCIWVSKPFLVGRFFITLLYN